MTRGFSDAAISVLKRGYGVREQGILCQCLGEGIAPQVLTLLDDGYEMEMLEQPDGLLFSDLLHTLHVLRIGVWTQPPREPTDGWLSRLMLWSNTYKLRWIGDLAYELYERTEPTTGYSLIHGDPTLANLMMRGSRPILSDPMPRLDYRWEIPERKEVDLGKLIQSAVGWEQQLGMRGCDWQGDENTLLHHMRPAEKPLALLWASIHLARVAIRAPKKDRLDIAEWAERQSTRLARKARGY